MKNIVVQVKTENRTKKRKDYRSNERKPLLPTPSEVMRKTTFTHPAKVNETQQLLPTVGWTGKEISEKSVKIPINTEI